MDSQRGNLIDKVFNAANRIQNTKQSNVHKTGKSTAEILIGKENITYRETKDRIYRINIWINKREIRILNLKLIYSINSFRTTTAVNSH